MDKSQRKSGVSLAESLAGSTAPRTKGRGERLIDSERPFTDVAGIFISGNARISNTLAQKVALKACQILITFEDNEELNSVYHGQAGLIRGEKLASTPRKVLTNPANRQRLCLSNFASYQATPVTAKHNFELDKYDCKYLNTCVVFADGSEKDMKMPDGGCKLADDVVVRRESKLFGTPELAWAPDDVSFGETITRSQNPLTKEPRLFLKAPKNFALAKGMKIGIAVYRAYEITHEDAGAEKGVNLESVYGKPSQPCIYTGEITKLMEETGTFLHNINAFKGCAGAVIFLLDEDQEHALPAEVEPGMAIGVHVGGADDSNNLGFILK